MNNDEEFVPCSKRRIAWKVNKQKQKFHTSPDIKLKKNNRAYLKLCVQKKTQEQLNTDKARTGYEYLHKLGTRLKTQITRKRSSNIREERKQRDKDNLRQISAKRFSSNDEIDHQYNQLS